MRYRWIVISGLTLSSLLFAQRNPEPYRAVVKTVTRIALGGQIKTVESLSTIAVNGNQYRLQTIQPSPQLYICDGTRTLSINPVTKARQMIPMNAMEQPAAQAGLIDLLNGMSAATEIRVDTLWGLPREVKTLTMEKNGSYPSKITFYGIGNKNMGELKILETATLSGSPFPSHLQYVSQSPQINIDITYSDIQVDPNMPSDMFNPDLAQ